MIARTSRDGRSVRRIPRDLVVFVAVVLIVIAAAASRREFLGDGVRHLPAILAGDAHLGEPRWLLFPVLAHFWIRALSVIGLVNGVESTLRALLVLCVASGVLFLYCLRSWLRAEGGDEPHRAAALLLAGGSAPFLMLFSDIAEPQLAAALAASGLAYARIRRDDPRRAEAAALAAIASIAAAALIYQGVILALGMLPLVVSSPILRVPRVRVAIGIAVLAMAATMIAAEIGTGSPAMSAVAATFGGERNPLTRSLMTASASTKYLAALVAGPPQGIVALTNYAGLRALLGSLRGTDPDAEALAGTNVGLLLLGAAVTTFLLISALRDRQWRVLAAAAILLALPIMRNQQYGYIKFYVMWPIPVALLASRCRARTIAAVAAMVWLANVWVMTNEIVGGRDRYRAVHDAYARATPATCWLTSGWAPPHAYLWPGQSAAILGTLATGVQPTEQASLLTVSLQRCFCDSESVWTDTTTRDLEIVRSITGHFQYSSIDFARVLIDPAEAAGGAGIRGVLVYSDVARQRACRALK